MFSVVLRHLTGGMFVRVTFCCVVLGLQHLQATVNGLVLSPGDACGGRGVCRESESAGDRRGGEAYLIPKVAERE